MINRLGPGGEPGTGPTNVIPQDLSVQTLTVEQSLNSDDGAVYTNGQGSLTIGNRVTVPVVSIAGAIDPTEVGVDPGTLSVFLGPDGKLHYKTDVGDDYELLSSPITELHFTESETSFAGDTYTTNSLVFRGSASGYDGGAFMPYSNETIGRSDRLWSVGYFQNLSVASPWAPSSYNYADLPDPATLLPGSFVTVLDVHANGLSEGGSTFRSTAGSNPIWRQFTDQNTND